MADTLANELGNVLIVGGGRMGQAIAAGLLRLDGFSRENVVIANPGVEKRNRIEETLGIKTVAAACEGLPADCVIIAVKPKNVPEAAASLVHGGLPDSTLVISIAAGISTIKLAQLLGNKLPIVRVMPNTPLMCGYGMSAISAGNAASEADCKLVQRLFSSMGSAVIIDEDKQDIACAVSGSGPAYYELFTQVISKTAQDLGLPKDIALELALQTMLGTAQLIRQTNQSLEEAIDAVSSPGGTTVAALDAMHSHGLDMAISEGVKAAARHSKELGS